MVFRTTGNSDPGLCGHPRVKRLGTQELPFPPFRLHLVNCLHCGDTLAVQSLREKYRALREKAAAASPPPPSANRIAALEPAAEPKARREA